MLEPPKTKYADLSGNARKLMDYMIDKLLELMEKDPQLAIDVGGVNPAQRRASIIVLADEGLLRLRTDPGMRYIWWTIYLMEDYHAIGGQYQPPERN
jgi:hypothetical protein